MTYDRESNGGNTERRPQNHREVDTLLASKVLLICLLVSAGQSIQVLNSDGQTTVGQHPEGNESSTESPVLVIHSGLLNFLLLFKLGNSTCNSLLEVVIDILFVANSIFDNGCLRILALLR